MKKNATVCKQVCAHVCVQATRAPYSMSPLRGSLASIPTGFGEDLGQLYHSLVNVTIDSS